MMNRRHMLLSSVAAAGTLCKANSTMGCATALPMDRFISINQEQALIVWDQESSTEHFIRSAQFVTDAEDFGFLVPTPAKPELHEAKQEIFGRLHSVTKAKVKYKNIVESKFRLFDETTFPTTDASAAPSRGGVEVLGRQQVAGYEAAMLKASDAQALTDWLNENGYATRPALTDWLQIYTDQDWVITAFKLSKSDPNTPGIVAKPVRLSFKTPKPFYPYREPADARDNAAVERAESQQRQLNVFFLADRKYQATIGENGKQKPAKVAWANSVTRQSVLDSMERATGLKSLALLKKDAFLTEFEDKSFPRQGTDELYFSVAGDNETVERPARIVQRTVVEHWPNIPRWAGWLAAIGICVPVGFFVKARRKRSGARNETDGSR